MREAVRTAAFALTICLLAAILAVLLLITTQGIRIEHTGSVALTGMADDVSLRMADPVVLQMPDAVQLNATSNEFPISLDLVSCPECGGAMLPVRWNLWTGEIEWACPACGATASAPLSPGE
jgi:hypothetical protein